MYVALPFDDVPVAWSTVASTAASSPRLARTLHPLIIIDKLSFVFFLMLICGHVGNLSACKWNGIASYSY